jgi:hypothetical protein
MTFPSFSAGEVLGAADMNAVGLWLVKTQTVGTGVSSVTVTGAFSASFDNYKITYTGGVSAADGDFNLTLGASTTGYFGGLIFNRPNSSGVGGISNDNAAFWQYGGGITTANGITTSFELYQPFLARPTGLYSQVMHMQGSSSALGTFTGFHSPATSYSSFTLAPLGTTLTGGTIRVYGYRN